MMEEIKIYKNITTSKKELGDIFVAWVAIALVMVVATRGFSFGIIKGFVVSFLTVGISFIIHEFAHKIIAQKLGYQAEFRKFTPTIILSIFFAFLGVIFVAPGAVMVRGIGISTSENGKISVAGPLSNLILGLMALASMIFVDSLFLKSVFFFVAFVNCMIGAFNMIPVWVLDGRKIYVWNKKIYFSVLTGFGFLYLIIKLL